MHKSLFAVTALTACGPSPERVAGEQALKQLEQAAKGDVGAEMGEVMKALGGLAGADGRWDGVDRAAMTAANRHTS